MARLSFLVALSSCFALAASSAVPSISFPFLPLTSKGCDVSKLTPALPANQTQVVVPSGQKPIHIGLGVGVQNYTCGASGTYATAGAVAELFDISCLAASKVIPPATLTTGTAKVWDALKGVTVFDLINEFKGKSFVLGQHFFVTSPSGTGLSPFFDFRSASQQGNPEAFFLAAKTGDIPAPTGPQDVDWLLLSNVQGQLAKTVLRIFTKEGQPPASCTPGSPLISVKYTAEYWFYA